MCTHTHSYSDKCVRVYYSIYMWMNRIHVHIRYHMNYVHAYTFIQVRPWHFWLITCRFIRICVYGCTMYMCTYYTDSQRLYKYHVFIIYMHVHDVLCMYVTIYRCIYIYIYTHIHKHLALYGWVGDIWICWYISCVSILHVYAYLQIRRTRNLLIFGTYFVACILMTHTQMWYIYIYIYIYIDVHIYIYICICISTYLYIHLHMLCIFIYISPPYLSNTYIYIYTYT